MWSPGDVIAWRGLFKGRIWHAMPTFVVKDSPQGLVLAIIPGVVCKVDKDYLRPAMTYVTRKLQGGWLHI